MRLSIQRLRWVLITGAVLLIAVLAAYLGYGRYSALKAYRRILARAGMTLTHDSSGVTWSQSVKGRRIVTVRAKTESSLGNDKYALQNAEVLLYTRSEEHPDHIYGSEMEYDQGAGVLRAKGEVFMDLQPPQGLTSDGGHAPVNSKPAAAQIIHVRTSGLVYVRKLGVASTDQQVQFSYGGMDCTAVGAEFDSDQSTLHLLADVHMDGLAHGRPLHVTATRADLDRSSNIAHLFNMIASSGEHSARADMAILNLRKDGSIERVQGVDRVVLSSATQQITANRLDGTLTPAAIPETGKLSGDVVLVDTDPLRPMHGLANVVDAVFNAQGEPSRVVASGAGKGAAKLSMIDRRANPRGLARSMEGAKIVASFVPGKRRSSSSLKELHVTGSAHAGGESVVLPTKNASAGNIQPLTTKDVQVWADDLRVLFTANVSGKAQPQQLFAAGHTMLQQDAALGERETSSADTLQMAFAAAPSRTTATAPAKDAVNIASAIQTGHVVIHDRAASKPGSTEPAVMSSGTADRASFNGATQQLTLIGDAHLDGDNASLAAPKVSLDQRTQDTEASGGVQATFESATRDQSSPGIARPESLTHVLSSSARFNRATQLASFYGTDAQPARLWKGASQVQAATLIFDAAKRTFSARPEAPGVLIHAIFASAPTASKRGVAPRSASILRVASPKMDYNDLQREATFSGGVSVDGTLGEVNGQHAAVFLVPAAAPSATLQQGTQPAPLLEAKPNPLAGSIARVIVYGSVQMQQTGRHGSGEQLLYTAATSTYVLTGTPAVPPRIVDTQQGSVTGATLLFTNAGSTIVVAADPGAPKGKGGRVRSEAHLRSAKEERQ